MKAKMKNRMIFLLIILFISLILVLVLIKINFDKKYVEVNGEKIFVEVADSEEEREKGLMFMEELCENCGILFIFEEERTHSLWMKNTLIPLDMIFINSNRKVVDVLHALPCSEEPCRIYTTREKALYVLETNYQKFNSTLIGKDILFSW